VEQSLAPEFNFRRFFYRSMLWNTLFLLLFGGVIFWCYYGYIHTTALHNTFVINVITVPIAWTHTVLLFIFMIRRTIKKNSTAALCFLGQFIFACIVSYYGYLAIALGLVYSLKGH
jgi:hypothetical protein